MIDFAIAHPYLFGILLISVVLALALTTFHAFQKSVDTLLLNVIGRVTLPQGKRSHRSRRERMTSHLASVVERRIASHFFDAP